MARTKSARKKGFLRKLTIDEVSSVGQGANQNAHQVFMKIENSEEVTKASFDEILGEMEVTDQMRELIRSAYKKGEAFHRSVSSIIHDSTVKEKKQAIKQSLAQFASSITEDVDGSSVIKEEFYELAKEVWKEVDPKNGHGDMPEQLKKLEEEIQMDKDLAYYQFLAGLSDVEKEFFASQQEGTQESIVKADNPKDKMSAMMEEEDKKKKKKKKVDKSDDEFITSADGHKIYKSEVGDGVFEFMKSQQTRIDAAEEVAKEEKQKRIDKELAEEAERMWPNLKGTSEEKATILKSIRALPQSQQENQIQMMKSADAAMANVLTTRGDGEQGVKKEGEDKLEALAKSHQEKFPGLTYEQAYAKVLSTPEGAAAYESMED